MERKEERLGRKGIMIENKGGRAIYALKFETRMGGMGKSRNYTTVD